MDTVVYRLHHLEYYPITLKAVEALKGNGSILIEDGPDLKGVTSFRRALFNRDKDSWNLMTYNAKLYIPSSSGGVNVRYDDSRGYIEFNLSLPKFYFGNNVCELIPPMQSKHYKVTSDMYGLCMDFWYNAMKYAFAKCVKELTGGLEKVKYWGHVQLARWDIAFNQIFNTKTDAFHYLESMRQVSLPRIPDAGKIVYDNGNVTFKTENYYFKVYHKGTDFERTGAPQIRNLFQQFGGKIETHSKLVENKILGNFTIERKTAVVANKIPEDSNLLLSLQKTDILQQYADRILRYEFEATSKFMSYVYNTRCAKWKIKAYKQLVDVTAYCCREDNWNLLQNVRIGYRGQDGRLYRSNNSLLIFQTEYDLPAHLVVVPGGGKLPPGRYQVTDQRQLRKVKRLLKYQSWLRSKYDIRDLNYLKSVHKFLEAEKSREHRFFFADPLKLETAADGSNYWGVEVSAQDAVDSATIPEGVHFDGHHMSIMQPVPKDQRLTRDLLYFCIQKHNELFKLLQFENLPEIKNVVRMVKDYNKQIDALPSIKGQKKPQKMNVRLMKMLYHSFKHDTWDDLRRRREIDRSTIYRWKEKCRRLFGSNNPINYIGDVDLSNVPRDPQNLYSRHYSELFNSENPLAFFMQNTYQLLLF